MDMDINSNQAWKLIAGCLYEAITNSQSSDEAKIIDAAIKNIDIACDVVEFSDKLGDFGDQLDTISNAVERMENCVPNIDENSDLITAYKSFKKSFEILNEDEFPNYDMSFDRIADMKSAWFEADLKEKYDDENKSMYFRDLVRLIETHEI